jgi:hypothetical protein
MVKYGNYSQYKKHPIFYIIASAICVALIGVALWALISFLSKNTHINWSMQGSYVTEDGQLKETMDLSITGNIQKDPAKRDILTLSISLPETFPYTFTASNNFYSMSDEIDSMPYYACSGYSFKKKASAPELCFFALDEEKQWAVFLWPDDPGQILVASADSGVDPKQIISHFQTFLDIHKPNE